MSSNIERTAQRHTVALADGQTISSAFRTAGLAGGSLVSPSGLSGTTLTFQGSHDGATFVRVNDVDGSPFSVTPVVGEGSELPGQVVHQWPWLKLVSDAAQVGAVEFSFYGEG